MDLTCKNCYSSLLVVFSFPFPLFIHSFVHPCFYPQLTFFFIKLPFHTFISANPSVSSFVWPLCIHLFICRVELAFIHLMIPLFVHLFLYSGCANPFICIFENMFTHLLTCSSPFQADCCPRCGSLWINLLLPLVMCCFPFFLPTPEPHGYCQFFMPWGPLFTLLIFIMWSFPFSWLKWTHFQAVWGQRVGES